MRKSKWLATLRRPLGAAAAAVVLLVLLLAVFAPILWSDKASALDTTQILRGPSAEHWMGTDSLGRDIFFRVLVATRLSVELAAAATAIGVVAGLLLGTAAVLLGKRLGRFVSAVVDIAVAFPGLLLALFFAVIFGVGARGSVLAIGLAIAPAFARLTRTLVARVLALDYVAAARIVGVRRFRLLGRHILPNVAEPLVVNATITTGSTLLSFAGLSFLGLGVQSPDFDWGRLLRDGLDGLYIHPAGALAPAVAVVVAGLAFSLFGEAVATTIGQAAGSPRRPELAPASPPADVAPSAGGHPVLAVEGLRVTFPGVNPVRGVSFSLGRGESVGVVGESGSGKSVTALALARLIEDPGQVHADRLEFLGKPLPEADRRTLGTSFAMVFQDPMTSFNPTQRVGAQLAEVARYHQGLPRGAAFARAVDRLRAVRLPGAARRARQLPHEFSGGMRQRAMIGMGLMGTPALIVADEPTTALDVTVQRRVLRLLADVREADDVAILLISHDMGVIRQLCDRVLVMYAGRIVEDLPAAELTSDARHPYTRALLAAVPDLTTDRDEPLAVIPGSPADPAELPEGCAFAPRCPFADAQCTAEDPPLVADTAGHRTACWHPAEALVPEQLQVGEAR
ncbi:dipeptide/oligopeptide/nickel ABC transporter permease/ATP-binding protein [Amycolatopsis acidicola]|uniref:Dipeptide/oligopeptide/nickel ABC transporter permease/ATP-binding protein n=1 Tax=Amycolatopsis acidicola TaxID=2596893 RepID=A0A5N0VC86_9PSEU|nr:dipeptide/oligopeptide/nickel ABC transporter permease/ATP-binding protein [Amycolatopsis acidicola]KAA9163645.1 dipeptide/oligopeptide/nickel ABC transporter permease/ATP-binding protein [Amycolatopsis acidicola]